MSNKVFEFKIKFSRVETFQWSQFASELPSTSFKAKHKKQTSHLFVWCSLVHNISRFAISVLKTQHTELLNLYNVGQTRHCFKNSDVMTIICASMWNQMYETKVCEIRYKRLSISILKRQHTEQWNLYKVSETRCCFKNWCYDNNMCKYVKSDMWDCQSLFWKTQHTEQRNLYK